ncbi:cell surface A33 antigen isoform X3 [Athene cunicularia]|uniref:cell surface A33 antigen isoform X3 n=1 Tax=Athene cunicularia TaxID=194338 RepID=UPI000EF6A094|nr:cell surface A33 antigen isoform X3 [Athene cunicularia]
MRRTAMKRLWLFVFSAILVTAHALTVEAPAKEIQVARGKNVTLRCNFKTEASITSGDVVVWRKIKSEDDAVTRYFDGLVQYGKGYENRIQFNGDVSKGDISITINAVTMEDNGTYACIVRLRNDPPRQTATLSLFVLVAPSKPECSILGTAEYGQTINLTCISHEGSPKPRYTWQSFNVQNEPRVLQTTEASMNIALYAGIIGGAVAAIIVIGILAYCCCCRADKDRDYEMTEREDRHEPSKEMPTRNQRAEDDVEDE